MAVNRTEYQTMTKQAAPKSPIFTDCAKAFFAGGAVCAAAEAAAQYLMTCGMQAKDARAAASLCLITLSVLLTALGAYDKLAKHAGAGVLVPITGFANAVAAPAIEYKCEGLIPGVGSKMFSVAGPVIVYGVAAAVLYGIILNLIRLFGG